MTETSHTSSCTMADPTNIDTHLDVSLRHNARSTLQWCGLLRMRHPQKELIESVMRNISVDVLEPSISDNFKKNKWESVQGKAKFAQTKNLGDLKVSFFGPFYAPYKILQLDSNYQYALVTSGKDYLWILSRETTIPEAIKIKYLAIAENVGYDTSRLLSIEHDKNR